jgi:hypothetical protein
MEKVSFTAGTATIACRRMSSPKSGHPPYQTVVFAPGANAIALSSSTNRPDQRHRLPLAERPCSDLPVYQGTYERGNGPHVAVARANRGVSGLDGAESS